MSKSIPQEYFSVEKVWIIMLCNVMDFENNQCSNNHIDYYNNFGKAINRQHGFVKFT